jgi:hypothetical protein
MPRHIRQDKADLHVSVFNPTTRKIARNTKDHSSEPNGGVSIDIGQDGRLLTKSEPRQYSRQGKR